MALFPAVRLSCPRMAGFIAACMRRSSGSVYFRAAGHWLRRRARIAWVLCGRLRRNLSRLLLAAVTTQLPGCSSCRYGTPHSFAVPQRSAVSHVRRAARLSISGDMCYVPRSHKFREPDLVACIIMLTQTSSSRTSNQRLWYMYTKEPSMRRERGSQRPPFQFPPQSPSASHCEHDRRRARARQLSAPRAAAAGQPQLAPCPPRRRPSIWTEFAADAQSFAVDALLPARRRRDAKASVLLMFALGASVI